MVCPIPQPSRSLVLTEKAHQIHALLDGTLSPCSQAEYLARLQHLCNVFEMTCLGSSLADFDHYSWRVAKEYDSRIVKDIEMGYKSWTSLDRNFDPASG